ncbi:Ig-like domain-containing protein [Kitasatospora sp. NPDC092286]|uniref:Ig-like domain-containing protein n=1 Tax=Kitasatospora sp. NPDC092286 TaxID=3364087 RepID=UPI00382B35B9
MGRQLPRIAAPPAPAPDRRTRRARCLRLASAGASSALAAGLLVAGNPAPSAAQQSPDAWSGEQRAVLPSGLSVQFDFSAAPGVAVTAGPGELADRSGAGKTGALYADGLRPGDPAQTFRIAEDRPWTDGSWRTVGTLRLAFSRPVRNPRLHLSGLAGIATGKGGTTSTATRLTLTDGSPGSPTLVDRTGWPGWTVRGSTLAPAGADGGTDAVAGSAAEGSLELAGTFRTAVFRVEQRSTARAGSTTAPAALAQVYTVTLDEGVGTAPQGYGNASHLVSDLFLGTDATTTPGRPARRAAATAPGAAGEPLVQLDHGAGLRGVWSDPASSRRRPGRGEYPGADPAVAFPAEAAIGRYYRLTVPVAVGDAPATLAGWIDFDHNGRFDPTERVQTDLPAGARTAVLEWTVPGNASSGETWARLRLGRDATQLVGADGYADSGQVSDQRVRLTVGAARLEIADPVDGAVVSDARPRMRGEGAVAGAAVEVRDGDTVLCGTRVGPGGDWSCRPGSALSAGAHSLTLVETTRGGVVLRGEPVRITVKTAPPGAPVLTLPEYTNDPGLQLTGTGEPGSVVSVADRPAGAPGDADTELCTTAVRADGGWSCLPVENLPDGRHRLTPSAADQAGNRTAGRVAELVVDTVAPDRPVLTAPAVGETVRVARPKLAGRAEAGVRVVVTARAGGSAPGSGEPVVACGATAAVDGSWTCTADRDLADGEQRLVVTATDLAGNGTAADAVPILVATATATASTGAAVPTPSQPMSPSPSVPTSSPTWAPTSVPTAVPSWTAWPSPSLSPSRPPVPGRPAPSVPVARPTGPASPVPAPVASSAAAAPSGRPVPSGPVRGPGLPGLLPIAVPPAAVPDPRPALPPASVPAPAAPALAVSVSPSAVVGRSAAPDPSPSAGPAAVAAPAAAVTLESGAGKAPTEASRQPAAPPAAPPAVSPPVSPVVEEPVDEPPVEASHASGRTGSGGWRGGLAGVLLLLTAAGLITRRFVARRPGAQRG